MNWIPYLVCFRAIIAHSMYLYPLPIRYVLFLFKILIKELNPIFTPFLYLYCILAHFSDLV